MRTFISCKLPNNLSDYLSTVTHLLPKADLSIPQQYDLTLKFLGNVPDDLIPEVCNRVSKLHFLPFQARLSILGVFSEEIIRVIWVGVEPANLFNDLHTQIDEALSPLFSKNDRFYPHITLARVQHVHNKKTFLERLANIPVEQMTFFLNSVVLMKSELTPKGAIHTPLFEISR